MQTKLTNILQAQFNKTIEDCTNEELYTGLLMLVKNLSNDRKPTSTPRKLYYISAEFLIGKLLSNNLINLGIYDEIKTLLADNGKNLSDIEEIELEPSLGNGGLGRLAACFLDSIATLNLSGDGVGLNYHFGLFKQKFENHLQKEEKNPWITDKSWLNDTNIGFDVEFNGFTVHSKLYDIDVLGYQKGLNKLHLFDIDTIDETIVNDGISFDQKDIRKNLTLFLYPDDSTKEGQMLRIYQQYFMVSNATQLILMEEKAKGHDLHELYKYVCIQINDTHPSMVIPELINRLVLEGIDLHEAIDIVSKTCAYTNHTILAEALEKWHLEDLKQVVPQLIPTIQELNAIAKSRSDNKAVQIIDEHNLVHMAHMDIHFGYSINGVASLHTEILKNSELKAFYELYPEKFNNKTNGITFRRWLLHCNHELSQYITSLIGDEYKTDAQIKRLHEYKRQQMNLLYIIQLLQKIRSGYVPSTPITFIFGAKAAPAYIIAKDIIHAILCLQDIIAKDPVASKYIQVIMVENYNVTNAEKLIPACDFSEQISLASKEASGTGNMKFMLNGAITIGTEDGANVEIHELVGDDNIYIFGESSDDVIAHYNNNDYDAGKYYNNDEIIKNAVDFLISEEMTSIGQTENLHRLHHELISKDWFMSLLDLKAYIQTKDQAYNDYEDRLAWAKKSLINIANAGYFSSDRTIAEYNNDIWHLDK